MNVALLKTRKLRLRILDHEERAAAVEAYDLAFDQRARILETPRDIAVEHLRLQHAREEPLLEARVHAAQRGAPLEPRERLIEVPLPGAEALRAEVVRDTALADARHDRLEAWPGVRVDLREGQREAIGLEMPHLQPVRVPRDVEHLDPVDGLPVLRVHSALRDRHPLRGDRVLVLLAGDAEVLALHVRRPRDAPDGVLRGEAALSDADIPVRPLATGLVGGDLIDAEVLRDALDDPARGVEVGGPERRFERLICSVGHTGPC